MNDPAESHDSGNGSIRPTVFVAATILVLLFVMVGGTFLYDSLFVVQRVVITDPIELYAGEGLPTVLLEMKAASTVDMPGFSTEMADMDGKPLFVSDEVGLTNDDVKSAGGREQDGQWVLEIHFTEVGARKLEALSKSLVADDPETATTRLAILLDGKLTAGPRVITPISGGGGQVYLPDLDKTKATRLARKIVGAE